MNAKKLVSCSPSVHAGRGPVDCTQHSATVQNLRSKSKRFWIAFLIYKIYIYIKRLNKSFNSNVWFYQANISSLHTQICATRASLNFGSD